MSRVVKRINRNHRSVTVLVKLAFPTSLRRIWRASCIAVTVKSGLVIGGSRGDLSDFRRDAVSVKTQCSILTTARSIHVMKRSKIVRAILYIQAWATSYRNNNTLRHRNCCFTCPSMQRGARNWVKCNSIVTGTTCFYESYGSGTCWEMDIPKRP